MTDTKKVVVGALIGAAAGFVLWLTKPQLMSIGGFDLNKLTASATPVELVIGGVLLFVVLFAIVGSTVWNK